MKRYILTGAPGCGKTTLIRALAAAGYGVVDEAATDIIAERQAAGADEPWTNPDFIDRIVELQLARQGAPLTTALQFHDRSIVCTYALALFLGHPPPHRLASELAVLARNGAFERRVFFIDHLGFCEPTAARRISFEDALKFEVVHRQAYRDWGFDCVHIPSGDVHTRMAAILAEV